MKRLFSKTFMKILFLLLFAFLAFPIFGKGFPKVIKIHSQHYYKTNVPKGNYSGLTWLGQNRYAVVSDKEKESGFYVFIIDIDSISGDILNIKTEGFYSSKTPNADEEGIAFHPNRNTLFIAREHDNTIKEYDLAGNMTGNELKIPMLFNVATGNYGFESLTYNQKTHLFWTTSESTLPCDGVQTEPKRLVENHLRLQSFNDSLQPLNQYAYQMDKGTVAKKAMNYAMGVSDLVALDDGKLIVLERELYVSPSKIGSFVKNKLYCVDPTISKVINETFPLTEHAPYLHKVLLTEWRTSLTLLHQDFANYEGICLAPKLADGSQVLLLCADSQDQYGGILRDWFRTIIIDQ